MSETNKDTTDLKEGPLLLFKGFCMGSADIIPGVSGGTMALILGIYERLLNAIKSVDGETVRNLVTFKLGKVFDGLHWRFLSFLLGGIMLAVLFFTKVVPLQEYMYSDPELIYGLFFGLIVGSIYILYKAVDDRRWTHALFLAAGIVIGFWVVNLVPTDTPTDPWFITLSGSVAIVAMVMPGISGSYILLILRKYSYILSNIGKLGGSETVEALWVLVPFGIGALLGLALFSRLLSWLLDRFHAPTLFVLIGFLIGSLYVIWPYQDRTFETFTQVKEVVAYNSETARELRQNPESTNKPEYHRLGDLTSVEGGKMIEVVEVKKKLVKSEPFLPRISEEHHLSDTQLWKGIIGMVIGIVLVGGLERIR